MAEQCWAVLTAAFWEFCVQWRIGCQGSCGVWDSEFFCYWKRVVSVTELLPQRVPVLSQAVTGRGCQHESVRKAGGLA